MQKEPTHLVYLPGRSRNSGVQDITVYCKIDTDTVPMGIQMVMAEELYKTLDPLFLYPIEREIRTPEKSAFGTQPFRTY